MTFREEEVSFESLGGKIAGILRVPEDGRAGERRPAFAVLHGFGSNKSAGNVIGPCDFLTGLGYATLRFDMRGCGDSDGERGHLICLEQVENTKSAVGFLQTRDEVDPERIGLIGSSFGAAVAIYTGGVDERVAAVISTGGWGDGETKFQGQHPTPEAWAKFTAMLEEGRRHREETGESLMVPRYDIVPIPEHLRQNLAQQSVQMFTAETAQSMYDFRANEVVGKMAPRPLLLLHSSRDSVTPTEQSIELFKRAGQPTDLHLFAETDHFMFAEGNTRVRTVVTDWLDRFFPVEASVRA
ncbi:MAG: alpha/beta hydrolase [Alphaproteobacteria bacterium]|nr:alpha/beta hydrolase [Alphaproteobacteria bacterium]